MFTQHGLEDYSAVHVQIIGAEDVYGPNARGKDVRLPILLCVNEYIRESAFFFNQTCQGFIGAMLSRVFKYCTVMEDYINYHCT